MWACVCVEYTSPMPVSGGWAAFEAMTGAAFAPIAVTGGVSIFIYRGGEGQTSLCLTSSHRRCFILKTAEEEIYWLCIQNVV